MKTSLLLSLALLSLLNSKSAFAGSATWNLNPINADWNRAGNWRPRTVPNGPSDTATFAISSKTAVSLSADVEVSGINFNTGANAFTITVPPILTLTISGVGIANNSGLTQNFVTAIDAANNHGTITFLNDATAGSLAMFINNGQAVSGDLEAGTQFSGTSNAGSSFFINNGNASVGFRGGRTRFLDSSTADDGTFTNNGCPVSNSTAGEGATVFLDSSTAGIGTFMNEAANVGGAVGGATFFEGASSAASGTFTNNGAAVSEAFGGTIDFEDNSTAGNGTFTNNGGEAAVAGGGVTFFLGASTAGNATFVNNSGTASDASPGNIVFRETSSAENGSFTNNGAAFEANVPATTVFEDSATAGNGTFTNNGGAVTGGAGGIITFAGNATGDNGTFTSNGAAVSGAFGSHISFFGTSSAGNGTYVINGGAVTGDSGAGLEFLEDSVGATSRLEVFSNGSVDISSRNAPSLAIGSLEGDGQVQLGANALTVGSNNLNTRFSGVIDGTGSLIKNGRGRLILSGTNTYTGGTSINGGTLLVARRTGSATGSGPVQVNKGTLAGTGKIAGSVTVGTGSGTGAFLSPGIGAPGTLAVNSALIFNSDASYNFDLNSDSLTADKIVASGVTINSGARFSFMVVTGPLPSGTVFTLIDNTAASPIGGTFSNLADGAIFSQSGNVFRASYEGGDGNDLTLTVQ